MTSESLSLDHRVILDMIEPGATVLDLGCGSGDLLYLLIREKSVRGQGIEIDEQAIYACVAKGLVVTHGDIDTCLADYHEKCFQYVILNQSLQQVTHFETVFCEALRVGEKAIIGLPNFAHYRARLQLALQGRAPITRTLPYSWYDSPNMHFLSMKDFIDFCRKRAVRIERSIYLDCTRRVTFLPNLRASAGVFLVSR